jgi:hypothetical protein
MCVEFRKSNKCGRGGAKPGAGRKKEPTTLLKEVVDNLDGDIPSLFEKLKQLCLSLSMVR